MFPKKIKTQKIVINSNATNWLVRNFNNSFNSNYSCWSKRFSSNVKKNGSWIGSAKRYVSNVQNEVSSMEDEAKKFMMTQILKATKIKLKKKKDV